MQTNHFHHYKKLKANNIEIRCYAFLIIYF